MPTWLSRRRDFISPFLASAALLAALFVFRLPALYAVGLFAFVWGGVWLWLTPDKGSSRSAPTQLDETELAEVLGEAGAARFRVDIAQAKADVARLYAAIAQIQLKGVSQDLKRLAVDTEVLITESLRNPEGYVLDRKALRHYLPQVVKLAESYAEAQRFGALESATHRRMRSALTNLVSLFARYKDRRQAREVLDMNIQIDVLEARLREDGIVKDEDAH